MMKPILTTIALLALAVSGLAQTRSVIVNTSGVVQSPTNFWSADVTNARSGLGLGTAATNAASAFQPSSLVLSNLSSSNGGALTNLTASRITGTVALASNVTGTIAISNGGSGATTAAGARTNLGLGAFSTNEVGFGNVKMSSSGINFIEPTDAEIVFGLPNDTDPVYLNPIHWNDGGVRTALGLGLSVLTNTNISNFRTAIGLGVTNNVTFGGLTAGFVNFENVEIGPDLKLEEDGDVLWGTFGRFNVDTMEFSKAISFNTTTNAAATRTNLSLGWSALTNSNTATALLGYNTNNGNVVMPSSITFSNNVDFSKSIFATTNGISAGGTLFAGSGSTISFYGTEDQSRWRTNLGLGWAALTNTSASGFGVALYGSGTNPVLYNTNGEVVSPTNFWQVAPINTFVQYSQPTGASNNVTNAATNARNLYLYSLTPLVTLLTNTITLPTNAATFFGDVATIIHEGPTNSFTAIRQIGSATNIISLNQFQEAVQFIYNGGGWKLADNISQVEPLYFSGTNAVAHAAASRTNLGLGNTNNVTFQQVTVNGNVINGSGFFYAGDVNVGLSLEEAWIQDFSSNSVLNWGNNTNLEIGRPINFGTNVATTRTNLGLGGGVTTNIDIKLNNNTGMRLYFTNGILTNAVPIP